MRKLARWGITITAVGVAPVLILVVMIIIDFYKYFTVFHQLFFTNDLWLLDPDKDRHVNIFPQDFFAGMVFSISYLYIAEMALMLIGSLLILKFAKKEHISNKYCCGKKHKEGFIMKKLCLLMALVVLFASGCFPKETIKTENVKLYYALKGNAGLGIENRDIEYRDALSKYKSTLNELLKGTSDSNKFEISIDKNTKVLSVAVDKENATVDFSKEFNVFSGSLHEAAVVSSVVDTLLQFNELKRVRILVEGQELIAPSGEPYGFMEFIDFNLGDLSQREIILYFADSQAMYLVPEKRSIFVKKDITEADFFRIVFEELIKGPASENLYRTIPEEVKLEYVELDGDLLKIDFSEEMHTKHWRGAAGESMTVYSIVNTATEADNVKRVMPTVEGGPLSIEHMVVEEPLTRDESIIYRQ